MLAELSGLMALVVTLVALSAVLILAVIVGRDAYHNKGYSLPFSVLLVLAAIHLPIIIPIYYIVSRPKVSRPKGTS